MSGRVDLDGVADALRARIPAWNAYGVSVGGFLWRDQDADWSMAVVADRSAVASPESLQVALTLPHGAHSYAITEAHLVYWTGGWADVNAVIRNEIYTDAPEVTDVDSCIAVAESVVARLSA